MIHAHRNMNAPVIYNGKWVPEGGYLIIILDYGVIKYNYYGKLIHF